MIVSFYVLVLKFVFGVKANPEEWLLDSRFVSRGKTEHRGPRRSTNPGDPSPSSPAPGDRGLGTAPPLIRPVEPGGHHDVVDADHHPDDHRSDGTSPERGEALCGTGPEKHLY